MRYQDCTLARLEYKENSRVRRANTAWLGRAATDSPRRVRIAKSPEAMHEKQSKYMRKDTDEKRGKTVRDKPPSLPTGAREPPIRRLGWLSFKLLEFARKARRQKLAA